MESDLEIQLKELNSRLVKENKKLRKEKEKLKNERDYFETEKKNIGEQLDGFYVEMGNMHLRNRKLQTECFELKEQIDSLQKEKTALELNGTKLESEIERLNLHIQKAIQLEFDLILEKQRSEQALRSEISLLKSNTSETIELKYQVKLLIASLPLYGAELKCHVEESIKSISLEKLRAKNEEIEALEASQRCYAEEIDAKEALILKLTNQVKAYMAEKKEIIENYEEDLEQAQEKRKKDEDTIQSLKLRISELESQKLRKVESSLDKKMENVKSMITNLEGIVDKMKEEWNTVDTVSDDDSGSSWSDIDENESEEEEEEEDE